MPDVNQAEGLFGSQQGKTPLPDKPIQHGGGRSDDSDHISNANTFYPGLSKQNLYHLPSRHIVEVGDMLMDVEGNRGVTITGWISQNNTVITNLGKFSPLMFRCVWQSKNVDCKHDWVTDSTGLVDDCTVCGESRA